MQSLTGHNHVLEIYLEYIKPCMFPKDSLIFSSPTKFYPSHSLVCCKLSKVAWIRFRESAWGVAASGLFSACVGLLKRAHRLGSLSCLQAAVNTCSDPSSTICWRWRGNSRLLGGWVIDSVPDGLRTLSPQLASPARLPAQCRGCCSKVIVTSPNLMQVLPTRLTSLRFYYC